MVKFKEQRTIVVCAFPGTGKSYATAATASTTCRCSDSDSSSFSWSAPGIRHPEFPQNYIDHIKELDNSGNVDIIFVSTHAQVMKSLFDNGIHFIIVYPDISLKEEYIKRYMNRGNNEGFINQLDSNWDQWITDIEALEEKDENGDRIIASKFKLGSGEYICGNFMKSINDLIGCSDTCLTRDRINPFSKTHLTIDETKNVEKHKEEMISKYSSEMVPTEEYKKVLEGTKIGLKNFYKQSEEYFSFTEEPCARYKLKIIMSSIEAIECVIAMVEASIECRNNRVNTLSE